MIKTEYIACMASELEVRTEGQISHDASLPNHGTYVFEPCGVLIFELFISNEGFTSKPTLCDS
jgi:hypothetical protein